MKDISCNFQGTQTNLEMLQSAEVKMEMWEVWCEIAGPSWLCSPRLGEFLKCRFSTASWESTFQFLHFIHFYAFLMQMQLNYTIDSCTHLFSI